MEVIHTAATALHIIFAAAWFGLAIGLSIVSKEAVRSESRGAAIAALAVTKSMTVTAAMSVVMAVVNFGIGLATRGVSAYGWPYHTALFLGFVLLAVQVGMIRPTVQSIRSKLGTAVARSGRSRLGLALGIGQAAWFGMLLLMYTERV